MKTKIIAVLVLCLAIGFLIQLPGDALSQEGTGTPQAPPTQPPPPNSRPTVAPPPPTMPQPTVLPPTMPPPNPRPDGFSSLTPSATPTVVGNTPTLQPATLPPTQDGVTASFSQTIQGSSAQLPTTQLRGPQSQGAIVEYADFTHVEDFEDDNFTFPTSLVNSSPTYALMLPSETDAYYHSDNPSRAAIARGENVTQQYVHLQVDFDLGQDQRVVGWSLNIGLDWKGATIVSDHRMRLLAYDSSGNLLSDQVIIMCNYQGGGSYWCYKPSDFLPVSNARSVSFIHETTNPVTATLYDLGLDDLKLLLQTDCTDPAFDDPPPAFPECPAIGDDDLITFNVAGTSNVNALTKDGDTVQWNTASPVTASALSPDGDYVAFIQDNQLYIMSYGGYNVRPLIDTAQPSVPISTTQNSLSWSSDGDWLAYIDVAGIHYIDLDGMTLVNETITYQTILLPNTLGATAVAYSHDNNDLLAALMPESGGLSQLVKIETTGITAIDIFSGEPENLKPYSLAWAGDTDQVAVLQGSIVYRYSFSTGIAKQVSMIGVLDQGFAWSPDSKFLMFVRAEGIAVTNVDDSDTIPDTLISETFMRTNRQPGEAFPSWRQLPPDLDCSPTNSVVHIERLYPGRSQEAKDMMVIADETGLRMHSAPTINAETVGNIPWDPTSTVTALERIEYLDPAGNVSQVWYRIENGTDPAWIAVYLEDILTVSPSPITSTRISYTVTPDPCPSLPTPPEVTFPYDREKAVTYAIAHAYQNEVQPPNGYFVTHRLNVTNLPMSGGNPIIDVTTVPYSYMYYNLIPVHNPPDEEEDAATGSAAFISEVFWTGGLPMRRDDEDGYPLSSPLAGSCHPESLTIGWRYCVVPLLGDDGTTYRGEANRVWYNHHWIIPYFTRNVAPDPEHPNQRHPDYDYNEPLHTIDNTVAGYAVPTTTPGNYVPESAVTWEKMKDFMSFDDGEFEIFAPATDSAEKRIADYAKDMLSAPSTGEGLIEYGDYAWISSPNNQTHGFIVAGWGTAVECSVAMPSGTRSTLTLDSGLYRTKEDAEAALVANAVPYVVDFSWQLQQPVPRPFYCSGVDVYRNDIWTNFSRDHNWYFFHIPDEITIPAPKIFVDTDWTWASTDGNYVP